MCSAPTKSGRNGDRSAAPDERPREAELHRVALCRHAPASVLLDREGNILHMSEHAGQYLLAALDESTPQLVHRVLPGWRAELHEALLEAARSGASVETPPLPFERDGMPASVVAAVRAVRSEQGQDYLLVLFDELRGRHQAPPAGELHAPRERLPARAGATDQAADDLHNLVAASEVAALFVDEQLRPRTGTAPLRQLLGLDEPVDQALEALARLLDYPELLTDLRQAGRGHAREREVPGRDARWYRVRLSPYRRGDRLAGAVLCLLDISEQHLAEQRARAGQTHMRLLAQSTRGFAIITTDPEGRVTSWNGAAERIFGFSEQDMLGEPIERIYSEEDRHLQIALKERKRALSAGSASDERWHVRADGEQIYLSGLVNPLIDDDRLLGFAKIARDLTEQKRQSSAQADQLEQAQASSQQKDQFFAVLSHELKHPLNLIQLNSDLLIRAPEVRQSAALSKAARGIQAAVRSQSRIIDDLMDVSRLRTGKLKLHFTTLHYQELLEGLEAVFRPLAQGEGVTFDSQYDDEPLYVEADPTRLEQIVWNLLNNAWKFTPAGGHISLVLRREGELARLEVSDTGQGISADFLPRVFELFGQAETPHSPRARHGLGIGLALVQQLVELHHGRIEAHSDGPGHGARFSVWLPLHLQTQLELADDAAPASPGDLDGLRILLVDDSPDVLEMLDDLLASEGASVDTARSGAEAVELAARQRYDVIVSDLGMPCMDGHRMIAAIRTQATNRDTPAIALSGYAAREDLEQARAAGFDQHLQKPIDLDSLVRAVRQARRQ